MGILQANILEWVAMSSSRGSSQLRDGTQVSHIAGRFFTVRATRETQENDYSSFIKCFQKIKNRVRKLSISEPVIKANKIVQKVADYKINETKSTAFLVNRIYNKKKALFPITRKKKRMVAEMDVPKDVKDFLEYLNY